jgi:DNA-binding protein HU-beta
MNKADLTESIAAELDATKADAGRALDAVLESITGALKRGDEVSLVGFGTFKVKHRAARKGRNPKTGEEIDIKAANVPSFKAGKGLKEAVN